VDTKGGNRPIRLAVKDFDVDATAYGKIFLLAYAFGDRLVIHDNWIPRMGNQLEADSLKIASFARKE